AAMEHLGVEVCMVGNERRADLAALAIGIAVAVGRDASQAMSDDQARFVGAAIEIRRAVAAGGDVARAIALEIETRRTCRTRRRRAIVVSLLRLSRQTRVASVSVGGERRT